MYLGMALRTFGCIRHFPGVRSRGDGSAGRRCIRTRIADFASMKVKLVTLQAQEGFILCKEIVGYSSVRLVTNHATFNNRFVLESERALFGGMTVKAEVI